jgi:hypothetical protein
VFRKKQAYLTSWYIRTCEYLRVLFTKILTVQMFYTVTCTGVTHDVMTGSSSDDCILLALRLQPLLITLNRNTIAIPHTFNITALQLT